MVGGIKAREHDTRGEEGSVDGEVESRQRSGLSQGYAACWEEPRQGGVVMGGTKARQLGGRSQDKGA